MPQGADPVRGGARGRGGGEGGRGRRVRRTLAVWLLTIAALGVSVGLVVLWQPHWLIRGIAGRAPGVLFHVPTEAPVVALTLDDGPDPETTPAILRVLARHDARATFFLISDRMKGRDSLIARIVREGHELANHLTEDRTSVTLEPEEFEAALLEADRALARFDSVRWFRPGGGWYSDTMLAIARKHGYRCALGSIYPYDVAIPWPAFAVRHVLRKARPGAVIILHDGGDRGRRTIEILDRVLPELKRRGLRVGTLSEVERTMRGSG